MTIPFHPLAEMFPLIKGKAFADLVADIKANGLVEPITLYEGKILEGRNRYLACQAAGVEPITREYQGTDPAAFVWSANFLRRHLTKSQRALAIAQFATLKKGNPHFPEDRNADYQTFVLSQPEAAKLAHVSRNMIQEARNILINGTEAEIAAVREGKAEVYSMTDQIRERAGLPSGSRAKVPDGYKLLSKAVFPGLELERNGTSPIRAAKKAGMSMQTYVAARDIVLLSERTDLSDRDMSTVRAALKELDETRRVKHPKEMIRSITWRVWGQHGNRFKSDKSRLAQFNGSVTFVVHGCSAIADCEIPVLEKKHRAETIKSITSAISSLTLLRRRLKKEEG